MALKKGMNLEANTQRPGNGNMTKLQPPPTYNSRYSHGPSPTYTVPTQFEIGGSRTNSPLVRIPEIKGHLALLRMFAELRNEVAELGSDSAPYIPVEGEKRWSWFVALAVERYVSVSAARLGGLLRVQFRLFEKVRYLVPEFEVRGHEEKF